MDAGNVILHKHGLWYEIAGFNPILDEDMSWGFDRRGFDQAIAIETQTLGTLAQVLENIFRRVPSVRRICLDTIHLPAIVLAVELTNLVGSFTNQASVARILRATLPPGTIITGFISDPYGTDEAN